MVSKSSGFLPNSSDLRLRERKEQFAGPEVLEDLLRDNEPVEDKLVKPLKTSIFSNRNHRFHTYVCLLLTVVSFLLRFYKIDRSNIVVWDEAHFGKFGSYYLKHEFYHDVHPPLGKMLIGLGEYLAGFDGDFDFSSNSSYPDEVNFKIMRQFNAIFSSLCTPLAFYSAKNLSFSMPTVYLVALMVCFEHSYIVLGKFVLLDSMLLFFTLLTFYCLSQLYRLRERQLTVEWLTWILATGFSIGCVCSVKWVGLLITALVGIYTVSELYCLHCDRLLSKPKYLGHWIVRISALIILPLILYMVFFKIHFALLYKTGTGDSSTHSLFQANLEGTQIKPSPRDIAFGSCISLRSHGLSPGLLHSHPQTYPDGSNQRQVTGYSYRDGNNNWIVKYSRSSGKASAEERVYSDNILFLKDGDLLRLVHEKTKNNLHTHQIPSHVSKGHYEVSGYGNDAVGDLKDDWIIEVVEQLPTGNNTMENKELIHPLTTSFRLRNKELGCYLAATGLSYPGWGYNQAEIVCKYPWNQRDKSTWWNVEDHINSNLHIDQSFTPPPTKFWTDFVVINFAMAASNNALIPDLDKYDRIASEPWEWPILYKGLRMCNWNDKTVKYYLLGSPFNTWLSTAALPILLILISMELFRYQRQSLQLNEKKAWNLFACAGLSFIGWLLHYAPFFIMGRVTYIHHYVPALFFAIMTFAYVVECALANSNRYLKVIAYLSLYAGCTFTYWYFAPLCQGMPEPNLAYVNLELLPSWDVTNAQYN
ncbi:Pmt6 [Kluyveromyces lactis]|nr:Pmt6 [Kluyveromyces lactis]